MNGDVSLNGVESLLLRQFSCGSDSFDGVLKLGRASGDNDDIGAFTREDASYTKASPFRPSRQEHCLRRSQLSHLLELRAY